MPVPFVSYLIESHQMEHLKLKAASIKIRRAPKMEQYIKVSYQGYPDIITTPRELETKQISACVK